jgi:hypothetical protein
MVYMATLLTQKIDRNVREYALWDRTEPIEELPIYSPLSLNR